MARRKCELGLWLVCCLLGAPGGVVPARLYAETRTAADLTPEAVGKAIDAAEDGDIVQLPAGMAVWSKKGWHTGHSPKAKAITIHGAGIDKTIITVDKSKSGNTYFEDNEVNLRGAVAKGDNPFIVAINAARVVIRHNKIVNAEIEIYGPGQRKYGCQTSEIYDNQFATVDGGRPGGFIFIAAGAAIVFNNTVTGTTYDCRVIPLMNHRAFMEMPPFGKADGKNPLDGNQIPAGQVGAGYPCFGQVGWATRIDGIFKPSPCYAWNNTLNGAKVLMAVGGNDPNQAAQIKEGREFFNEKPPEGYYKPYIYPHPLQGGQ